MSDPDKPLGACCCVPPAAGLRVLTFPDGTKAGVFGIDEAFAAVYAQGRQADSDTAEQIVDQLAVKNYIAPTVRERYIELIVGEYETYVNTRQRNHQSHDIAASDVPGKRRSTRWLSRFIKRA